MQVFPHPPKEIALNSEVHELVQNYISVGNIEGAFQVDESNNTIYSKAGVQLHEAVVRTTLCEETIKSGR
ncbi:hypothetical protein E2C01_021957 [Portunus trituberculatus]|uniref:Uncharacterized protein n=1 Tax=Portunus trituberculatus TaxID=210409 RepID=A0A5B7E5Z2_PORTR|nr:hypothetical protein [Portunus trituberculatus]